MSTPADLVRDLAALLDSLATLLGTQTAREAPAIARDLGVRPQLVQGVNAIGGALDKIQAVVVPLRRTLLDADALVALLGFVPGMVASVGDAVDSSADWLATLGLGLDDVAGAARQVSGPLNEVSGVLDMGVDAAEGALALVAPDQWIGVLAGLEHLKAALAALKEPPAAPA